MEFFSAFAAPVVSAGTSLCACNCFYCRTSGTEKAGLSGDSGAVGGKSHKGKLFFVFCGKRRLSHLLCKELSVLRTSLFLAGLLVWIQKGGSSWLSGQEENGIFAVWTSCFLEYGCYGAEVAGKAKCLGTQEEYAGTIFLAICIFLLFIGWQNFYVENSLTRALAKVGKTIPCLSMFFTMRFCRPCPDALKAEGACLQWDTSSMG